MTQNENNTEIENIGQSVEVNQQILKDGIDAFNKYIDKTHEINKYEIKENVKIENKKIETAKVLDKREKLFKGYVITICIIVLIVIGFYEKLTGIATIIGVILGAVLSSNSVENFLTKINSNKENHEI